MPKRRASQDIPGPEDEKKKGRTPDGKFAPGNAIRAEAAANPLSRQSLFRAFADLATRRGPDDAPSLLDLTISAARDVLMNPEHPAHGLVICRMMDGFGFKTIAGKEPGQQPGHVTLEIAHVTTPDGTPLATGARVALTD